MADDALDDGEVGLNGWFHKKGRRGTGVREREGTKNSVMAQPVLLHGNLKGKGGSVKWGGGGGFMAWFALDRPGIPWFGNHPRQ